MFRASSIAPLFLGTDGLTSAQTKKLEELERRREESNFDPKKKLTPLMTDELNRLKALVDAPIELSTGAKTLIKKAIKQEVYEYRTSFGSKETEKGTNVEDEAINLYNSINFTSYSKLDEGDDYYALKHDIVSGHPDIVDEDNLLVIDIKSPWSKDSFPVDEEEADKSLYEWQIKTYLWMLRKMTGLDWRNGRVAYMLVNTPEELLSDWDEPSQHYMDDLPLNLRYTYVDFILTDEDIIHIENRLEAAKKFASEYKQKLINK